MCEVVPAAVVERSSSDEPTAVPPIWTGVFSRLKPEKVIFPVTVCVPSLRRQVLRPVAMSGRTEFAHDMLMVVPVTTFAVESEKVPLEKGVNPPAMVISCFCHIGRNNETG